MVVICVCLLYNFAANHLENYMEDNFNFDIGGILSEEEADKFFEVQEEETEEKTPETEPENEVETEPAEKEPDENPDSSEKVGEDENTESEGDATEQQGGGSSPNVFSSIASALKEDGILPDFEDSELEAVTTPEAFAELFEKAINQKLDEKQRRVLSALDNGVKADDIRMYEQTIQYLDSLTEDAVSAEGEEGETLRKQLIYNDLINRGYTDDKAKREIEKSFKSASDIDDAKDALDALKKFYKDSYSNVQNEAKKKADALKESQKKQSEDFKKMILEDEMKLGDKKIDKRTCQRIFDAVSKPVYKDPDTGHLLTAVQKFQKENPMEFLKQLGMWFVLTDGGKNMDGFTKQQVREEKNKGIKELARKINASTLNADGSLKFDNTVATDGDLLLSDDWKIM